MTAKGSSDRKARLSAALRENLKRRKTQARVKETAGKPAGDTPKARILDDASQAGFEDNPQSRPKGAANTR
jgi:hypothetical protein